MKKSVLIIILVTHAVGVFSAEKIRFGISATYPPFEYLDARNDIIGFDIDFAKALCKKMKIHCTFINHTFDSLIPSLKYKKYDAVISGMDITPERSKQVAFTEPYYPNSAVMIIKKKNKYFDKLQDLRDKRIGMENGSTYQKYFHDKHPEAKTVSYDSYQNAIIDLKNGRIDGVFGNTDVINEWLKTDPQLLITTIEKIDDLKYFGVGFGIAVRSDNKLLLDKFNKALRETKNDGTWQTIRDKWFS